MGIPHITGALSLLGSGWILYDIVWAGRKRELPQPYSRIILCISIFDFLSSASLGLSTWPIPRGTDGVYGAVGTTQSCTAQGFFGQLFIGSLFYNMMLAIYYLLIGKYKFSEEEITRRYEPWMHLSAITFTVAVAVAGLPLRWYNNANLRCGHAPQNSDGEPNTSIYIIPAIILVLIIAVVTISMIKLTISIRKEEKEFVELKRNDGSNSERFLYASVNLQRSRKMFFQAVFYLGAFYLTWWAPIANIFVLVISGKSYFFLMLAVVTFAPLQGFFNFLVRVLKYLPQILIAFQFIEILICVSACCSGVSSWPLRCMKN